MSIIAELRNKAGRICDRSYRRGNWCPLIIRTTSEDVLVANVFGILKNLNPDLWLADFINVALPYSPPFTGNLEKIHFHFWKKYPIPERATLNEGTTEIDLCIQSGDLIILVEAKYHAKLSSHTTHSRKRDQLLRSCNIAYHLLEMSKLTPGLRVITILLAKDFSGYHWVKMYRRPRLLLHALSRCLVKNYDPKIVKKVSSNLGLVTWNELRNILEKSHYRYSEPEKKFLRDLISYIGFKLT